MFILDDLSYRTQYAQDECYDYNDDIDQLFSLSQELIKLSKSRTKTSKKDQDDPNLIKEEQYFLIRILYCYILPKVQLYKDDLPKVIGAIEQQTSHIEKINQDIERDSQTLDGLYHVLQLQQDQWLTEFENIARKNKSCTRRFLKTLQKHLERRKDHLDEQLEQRQNVVTDIKKDIKMNGTTPEKERELEVARKHTAICHQTLQQVLIVSRDAIKTALTEHDVLENDTEEIVLNYMKSSSMLVNQKSSANRQMDKKVRATSILENLKFIKNKIETNGVAGSTSHSSSGDRPTDVLSGMHVPEFETLSERVSAIVKNKEHPFGLAFQECVNEIQGKCQEILDQPTPECQKKRRTKQLDNYIVISHDGTIRVEYQSVLQHLVDQIKEHFWIMASKFQQHFNGTSYVVRNKLQLCYEDNFYNAVGKNIMNVYCILHQHQQQKMISDLEIITKLPINCLDLGMKDEWWLELFEKRRKVISSRTSSSQLNSLPSSASSSSQSSTDSTTQESIRPRRPPSRMRRFLSLMRRESQAISSSYGDGTMISEPNGTDQRGNLDDLEWIPGKCSLNLEKKSNGLYEKDVTKFDENFGPSLDDLRGIFQVSSILGKLQCLTSSLRKVTVAVQELRRQVLELTEDDDSGLSDFSLAITGDDMLPLIVLMILQLDPNDAAALQAQLKMMQDLIPDFLSAGCHGWALMEFQMACQVLQNLCRDFSWNESFNHSSTSLNVHE